MHKFDIQVRPLQGDNPAARALSFEQNDEEEGRSFNICGPSGAHWARTIARRCALDSMNPNRFDSEGFESIDLEANSRPAWKKWRAALSFQDAFLLGVFRGGAVSTPTRNRGHGRGGSGAGHLECFWCDEQFASMRHFMCDCPRFQPYRDMLRKEHKLSSSFFSSLPRCTSKTGWITYQASPNKHRRVQLQILVCSLALIVLADLTDRRRG